MTTPRSHARHGHLVTHNKATFMASPSRPCKRSSLGTEGSQQHPIHELCVPMRHLKKLCLKQPDSLEVHYFYRHGKSGFAFDTDQLA
jgi:hypothetical protein